MLAEDMTGGGIPEPRIGASQSFLRSRVLVIPTCSESSI